MGRLFILDALSVSEKNICLKPNLQNLKSLSKTSITQLYFASENFSENINQNCIHNSKKVLHIKQLSSICFYENTYMCVSSDKYEENNMWIVNNSKSTKKTIFKLNKWTWINPTSNPTKHIEHMNSRQQ